VTPAGEPAAEAPHVNAAGHPGRVLMSTGLRQGEVLRQGVALRQGVVLRQVVARGRSAEGAWPPAK
jgi:hypothetical protein